MSNKIITFDELINLFKNEYIIKLNQYKRLNIIVNKNNAIFNILINHKISKIKNFLYILKYNIASLSNLILILFLPKIKLDKDSKVFLFTDIRHDKKIFNDHIKLKLGLYNFRYFKYKHILQTLSFNEILTVVYSCFENYSKFKMAIKDYCKKNSLDYEIFRKLINPNFFRYLDIILTIKSLEKNSIVSYAFGSHFDIYASLLSLLRKKNIIFNLSANQHGLYEFPIEGMSYNKLFTDCYILLFRESKKFFEKYLNANPNCIIKIIDYNTLKNLDYFDKKDKKLIVFAMQNDDYEMDKKILKQLIKKFHNNEYIIVVYTHPKIHKKMYKRLKAEFKNIIFEKNKRYKNVDILYTRYSTIGMQYKYMGVKVCFLLFKERVCITLDKFLKKDRIFIRDINDI